MLQGEAGVTETFQYLSTSVRPVLQRNGNGRGEWFMGEQVKFHAFPAWRRCIQPYRSVT